MSSEWRECTLGEVLEVKYGKDHKKLKKGSIPCYGTGGVMRYVDSMLYDKESILLPRKGSLNNIYFINEPFWTVDTLFWSKINDKIVFPKFLYYYLTKFDLTNLNVGSAVPSLTVPVLNNLRLTLPPLPEQKAIAHILGTLDDKIELNRKMNETLEQMAQALFKSWFVDFDPVLDNALAKGNKIPEALKPKAEKRKEVLALDKYKALPKELMELFPSSFEYHDELEKWIPEGWEVSSIGQEFDVTMGQSPPGSSYNEEGQGMPFFQGKTDFGFRFPTNRIYCTEPKRTANINDTLISVRAPVGNANLALSSCAIGRGLAALRHKSKSISFTYYSILELKEIFDVFEGEGTVFGSINQTDLKNISVIKSDPQIMEQYDIIAKSYDKKIEINENQISSLIKQRDVLLPQLTSGKLKVSDINIET